MTREEAIECLTDDCRNFEELNGIHSYFVVAVGRPDIEFYGTEEQLVEFDKATPEDKQQMLDDIAEELEEIYEDRYFGESISEIFENK
jgi:hypothetical protein